MPALVKKLVLLVLSVGFALALAEGSLRLYFWTKGIGRGDVRGLLERSRSAALPKIQGGSGLFGLLEPSPYPEVVYQLKPDLHGIFRTAEIETNRFGLRGPRTQVDKPANTYRIVGLGDSHMFGWGVGQQNVYLVRLEKLLNQHAERGWHFETLNFAAPGYNTVMEVGMFEHRALAFSPDLVLLHFIGNDVFAPHFLDPPRSLAPSHWYLVELVRGLLGPAPTEDAMEGAIADEGDDEAAPPPDPSSNHKRYSALGGHQACAMAMRRLGELARQHGIPAVMFQLGENSPLRRWSKAQAQAAGLGYFDASPTFDALLSELGGTSDRATFHHTFVGLDDHPNARGHQAYARAIFCQLEAMRIPHLLPAPEITCP